MSLLHCTRRIRFDSSVDTDLGAGQSSFLRFSLIGFTGREGVFGARKVNLDIVLGFKIGL